MAMDAATPAGAGPAGPGPASHASDAGKLKLALTLIVAFMAAEIVVALLSSSLALSWTGSVDNVAVAGYGVYVNGSLVGTTTALANVPTSKSDVRIRQHAASPVLSPPINKIAMRLGSNA